MAFTVAGRFSEKYVSPVPNAPGSRSPVRWLPTAIFMAPFSSVT